MAKESDKSFLEHVAGFYDVAEDFDFFNTKLASEIICPECNEKTVLEVGCATGVMTENLLEVSKSLTVVEPSSSYCRIISEKYGTKVQLHNCFLEDIEADSQFDVVILASLLHHFEKPEKFMETTKRFIKADGCVLATVPNIKSLHRQVGVKAGMLKNEYDSTERNAKFSQPGRFDKTSFENLFNRCSFKIIESFTYMLKPFSSEQMLKLNLDWNIINALFEIGKEYPSIASQLYIKAVL